MPKVSIKELRTRCQKSKNMGDILESSYICFVRKLSIYFTWIILRTPLSANHITFLGLISAFIGSLLLVSKYSVFLLLGTLLLQLFFLLDLCDGEISRFRKSSSLGGAYFDSLVHNYSNLLPIFLLAIGVYIIINNVWVIILGFIGSYNMVSFLIRQHTLMKAIKFKPEIIKNLQFKSLLDFNHCEKIEKKRLNLPSNKVSNLIFHSNLLGLAGFIPLHMFNLITLVVFCDCILSWWKANKVTFEITDYHFRLGFLIFYAVFNILRHIRSGIRYFQHLKSTRI